MMKTALFLLCLLLASPAAAQPLHLLAVHVAPRNADGHDAFGGISGLDYDARSDTWLMISDDRSEHAAARIYRARLTPEGIADVTTIPLHREDGALFPAFGTGSEGADGEAIRLDGKTGTILWASEGDYRDGFDPAVRWSDDSGATTARLPLPAFLHFDRSGTSGPRENLTIEGLSFAPDSSLWLSIEAPLIEDGPLATTEHGARTRLLHFGRDGAVIGQYAYPLDAIRHRQSGRHADDGISDILLADASHLWVLERAGEETAPHVFRFHCRLYEVDLRRARPVTTTSLGDASVRPTHKRLLVDFDRIGLGHTDNYEGVSFGPRLPDGHRSLVVVSDDNFSADQRTQFLIFDAAP